MSERLYIGCDPDMHTCPIVWVDESLKLLAIMLQKTPDKLREQAAVLHMTREFGQLKLNSSVGVCGIAVEAQELYQGGENRTKNPRNILHLGHVAGAALACLQGNFPDTLFAKFPLPIQWKGNVPKHVHHKRILHAAGIHHDNIGTAGGQDPYCYIIKPDPAICPFGDPKRLNKGDWKHICDSIGLAQWVAKEHADELMKQKHLAAARGGTIIEAPPTMATQRYSGKVS